MYKTMIDTGLLSNEQMFYRSQILSEEKFGRIKSNIGERENGFFFFNI